MPPKLFIIVHALILFTLINLYILQWLGVHPDFVTNPVFLGSDSYAGMIIPILAQDIINGNLINYPH
jgi:hypothetical protein